MKDAAPEHSHTRASATSSGVPIRPTGSDAITAVTRHSVRLAETGWDETSLTLPAGTWRDRLGGSAQFSGTISVADLLAELPVALLERIDD